MIAAGVGRFSAATARCLGRQSKGASLPGRMPRVTGKDIGRALERAGWAEVRTRGSHVRLAHPDHAEQVTVPVHSGEIIGPDLLKYIMRQAGMTIDEFERLLRS